MLSQTAIFPLALLALPRQTGPHWFAFPTPVLLWQVHQRWTCSGVGPSRGCPACRPASCADSSQPVTSTCLLNTLIPRHATHVCAQNLRERCFWKCSALGIIGNSAQVRLRPEQCERRQTGGWGGGTIVFLHSTEQLGQVWVCPKWLNNGGLLLLRSYSKLNVLGCHTQSNQVGSERQM